MTWIPWPHISEIMLAASVTKQSPCWDNSTLANLIRLNINLDPQTWPNSASPVLRDWLSCIISLCFRHVKSKIINCLKILRKSHNPRGYAFPPEIARNRAKQDVGEPGCRAGRGCEMCPQCPPMALFFPDTLSESCVWELFLCSFLLKPCHPSSTHAC